MDLYERSESNKLAERERRHRRQLRISQVRQQTDNWTSNSRARFEEEKARQLKNIIHEVTETVTNKSVQNLQELFAQHEIAMGEVGDAHRAAAMHPNTTRLERLKRAENVAKAAVRFDEAMRQEREERLQKQEDASRLPNIREAIRQKENDKAKFLAERRPLRTTNVVAKPESKRDKLKREGYQQSIAQTLFVPLDSQDEKENQKIKTRKRRKKTLKPKSVKPKRAVGQAPPIQGGFANAAEARQKGIRLKVRKRRVHSPRVPGDKHMHMARSRTKKKRRSPDVLYVDSNIPLPPQKYKAPPGLVQRVPHDPALPSAWKEAESVNKAKAKAHKKKQERTTKNEKKARVRGSTALRVARLEQQYKQLASTLGEHDDELDAGSPEPPTRRQSPTNPTMSLATSPGPPFSVPLNVDQRAAKPHKRSKKLPTDSTKKETDGIRNDQVLARSHVQPNRLVSLIQEKSANEPLTETSTQPLLLTSNTEQRAGKPRERSEELPTDVAKNTTDGKLQSRSHVQPNRLVSLIQERSANEPLTDTTDEKNTLRQPKKQGTAHTLPLPLTSNAEQRAGKPLERSEELPTDLAKNTNDGKLQPRSLVQPNRRLSLIQEKSANESLTETTHEKKTRRHKKKQGTARSQPLTLTSNSKQQAGKPRKRSEELPTDLVKNTTDRKLQPRSLVQPNRRLSLIQEKSAYVPLTEATDEQKTRKQPQKQGIASTQTLSLTSNVEQRAGKPRERSEEFPADLAMNTTVDKLQPRSHVQPNRLKSLIQEKSANKPQSSRARAPIPSQPSPSVLAVSADSTPENLSSARASNRRPSKTIRHYIKQLLDMRPESLEALKISYSESSFCETESSDSMIKVNTSVAASLVLSTESSMFETPPRQSPKGASPNSRSSQRSLMSVAETSEIFDELISSTLHTSEASNSTLASIKIIFNNAANSSSEGSSRGRTGSDQSLTEVLAALRAQQENRPSLRVLEDDGGQTSDENESIPPLSPFLARMRQTDLDRPGSAPGHSTPKPTTSKKNQRSSSSSSSLETGRGGATSIMTGNRISHNSSMIQHSQAQDDPIPSMIGHLASQWASISIERPPWLEA